MVVSLNSIPSIYSLGACVCLLLALLQVAGAPSQVSAEDFKPNRVRLLSHDPTSTNWLFRGNLPVINGTFVSAELDTTMRQVAANQSLNLPSKYLLWDISFLWPILPKEEPDLMVEEAYFKANQSAGELINWPLLGELGNPNSFASSLRKEMAITWDSWSSDKLPTKMSTVEKWLSTPHSQGMPVVLYAHCEAGVDRTGAFSGLWNLIHNNMTYTEVMAINDAIEPRPIAKDSEHSVMWGCLWLHWGEKVTRDLGCPSQ